MVKVLVTDELKPYEADIRDLCLAFFSFQKVRCIYDEKAFYDDGNSINVGNDILIKDYFSGSLIGERIKVKSELKRQLYDYLSNLTGKKLLWGTLTGIRPVTIVTKILEEDDEKNKNDIRKGNSSDILKYLNDEYYLSNEKGKELLEISKKELDILSRKEVSDYKDRYSVYVGVPFCKSTCLYCSFTSFNIDKYKDYVNKYLDALETELKNNYSPLTLYVGGGTPTSFSDDDFERFLTIIDGHICKDLMIEYTVEAGRPDTITRKKLMSMKKHGVTRISINPQSFNQKTLDLIGRKHTVRDVIEKFELARDVGFDNINMDIILGLPDEHLIDVIKTLCGVYKLKPESFTVHSLALKRAARLNYELDSWVKNYYLAGLQNIIAEGKREIDKMFKLSRILADLLGLEPYYLYRQKNIAGNLENVGYAKKGKECVYNIMMMSERHTVYGFGTATTKEVIYENDSKRVESIEGYKSVIDYVNNIKTKE